MTAQTGLNQASSTRSILVLGNLNAIGLLDSVPGVLPTIIGTSDSDVLVGTDGNDIISGLEGRDTLFGGAGNDVLIGGLDSDRLIGGSGRDVFVFNNFNERTDKIVDFNVGQDTLVLNNLLSQQDYNGVDPVADGYLQFVQDGSSTRVQVDPDGVGEFPFTTVAILENVNAESLTAVVFNEIIGTASSDSLQPFGYENSDSEAYSPLGMKTASLRASAERSSALLQADRLIGTNANDFLVSLEGNDTLIGGAGDDILVGGLGSDILTGGAGSDRFVFNNFNEQTDRIKDFNVDEDQLLLVNLLAQLNYNGIDPITDGYVQFVQQGLNTNIQVKSEAVNSLFTTIAVLENVAAGDLVVANNLII
jgi:Ca2+-binding RTX toxin-like protein